MSRTGSWRPRRVLGWMAQQWALSSSAALEALPELLRNGHSCRAPEQSLRCLQIESLEERRCPSADFLYAIAGEGSGYYDYVDTVVQDEAGNLYVAGTFTGTVDFEPGDGVTERTAENNDVFIAKYSAAGELQWVQTIATDSYYSDISAESLAVDNSGNVYVIGSFRGTIDSPLSGENGGLISSVMNGQSSSTYDIYVTKLNGNGSFQWFEQRGGSGEDFGNDIDVIGSDIVIGGTTEGGIYWDASKDSPTYNNGDSGSEAYIARFSDDFDFEWVRSYGGEGGGVYEIHLDVDSAQDIYAAINIYGYDTSYQHGYLFKVEGSDGTLEWYNEFEGKYAAVTDLAVDPDGNVTIVGEFENTVMFSSLGREGYTTVTGGYYAAFVVHYDSAGYYQWGRSFGTSSYQTADAVFVDNEGGIYIAGYFGGDFDYDPTDSVPAVELSENDGGYLIKLDGLGHLVDQYIFTSPDENYGSVSPHSIHVNGSGQIALAGSFYGTVDLDPGDGTYTTDSGNGEQQHFVIVVFGGKTIVVPGPDNTPDVPPTNNPDTPVADLPSGPFIPVPTPQNSGQTFSSPVTVTTATTTSSPSEINNGRPENPRPRNYRVLGSGSASVGNSVAPDNRSRSREAQRELQEIKFEANSRNRVPANLLWLMEAEDETLVVPSAAGDGDDQVQQFERMLEGGSGQADDAPQDDHGSREADSTLEVLDALYTAEWLRYSAEVHENDAEVLEARLDGPVAELEAHQLPRGEDDSAPVPTAASVALTMAIIPHKRPHREKKNRFKNRKVTKKVA